MGVPYHVTQAPPRGATGTAQPANNWEGVGTMAMEDRELLSPHIYRERIGDREWDLREVELDVFEDVELSDDNPRLLPFSDGQTLESQAQIEAKSQRTPGYAELRSSLERIGQLEPVYVFKTESMARYLVLEGNTRVTAIRELARAGRSRSGTRVRAKILPPTMSQRYRVALLTQIHVRGSGVRGWGRYVEARYIWENTTAGSGNPERWSVSEMADFLGKSNSWVSRLRDAYKFAKEFVDYLDSDDAHRLAMEHFSVLEEIIKTPVFGPQLKGNTPQAEQLRSEVFEIVKAGAFKEYRDARFMRQFHEDPELWEQLKSGEPDVAHRLANQLKAAGPTTIAVRIRGLAAQVDRAVERDISSGVQSFSDSDLEELENALMAIASHLGGEAGRLRIAIRLFIRQLEEAPLKEVRQVTATEYESLMRSVADFKFRVERNASWQSGSARAEA